MPIITQTNVAEITAGAGALPIGATPDGAAPAVDANPGFRDAMLAALPAHAAAEKIPPERYEVWRAERVAKIDADTGYVAPDPLIAAEAARAEAHAVNPTASADQFKMQWPADFVSGAKHLGETTAQLQDFASAMKFPPEVGRSVLERLAVLSSTFRGMTQDQATTWKLNAEQALKSMFGDQADAKLQAARKALEIAGPEHKLAELIGQSLQVMDLELVVALTGHADRWEAFSKRGKS